MTLLFIFFLFISITAASVAFWVNRRKQLLPKQPQESFNPPPKYRSLFEPDEEEVRVWQKEQDEKAQAEKAADLRLDLLTRAEKKDFNTLLEAKVYGNARLYDEVFQVLIKNDDDKLAGFVTRNSLTANAELVELSAKKLSENPDLDNLLKFVHLSALTNSAEVFINSIETTRELWKQGRLNEISDDKLIEILDSHYWLLAAEARVSGAGYLLKEKMASVRQEILGK